MKSIYRILALAAIAVTALVSCQKDPEKTDEPEETVYYIVTPSGEQTISKVFICMSDYLESYAEVQFYAKEEDPFVVGIPEDFWGKTAGIAARGSSQYSYFWDPNRDEYPVTPASKIVGPGNSLFFSIDEAKSTIILEVDLKTDDDRVYSVSYSGPVEFTEKCWN